MVVKCLNSIQINSYCFLYRSDIINFSDASLTPTSIENVCPGDRINLTCTVTSDVLRWLLPNPSGGLFDVSFLDSETDKIGIRTPVASNTMRIYTVILDGIDMNPTRLTSTVEVILLMSLTGRRIECSGSSVTIQFNGEDISIYIYYCCQ